MADLTVTASAVKPRSATKIAHGIAGATITAMQALYKEDATKKLKLADNDSVTAEVRSILGLSLHAALDGQPLAYAENGSEIDVGAIMTAGTDYYLSGTPGGICVRADVTTGDDPIRIGFARTPSVLVLDFADFGVTL